jgi:hypothetical protein
MEMVVKELVTLLVKEARTSEHGCSITVPRQTVHGYDKEQGKKIEDNYMEFV